MVQCWLLADQIVDPCDECHRQPPEFIPIHQLNRLGIKYHYISVDGYKPKVEAFAKAHGFLYNDEVKLSRATLPDYETKIRQFFEEHLHKHKEVRYMVDGVGYFDVRNLNDEWIRIKCEQGDLLIIPAGIYHRFTVTHSDYVHAVRLFLNDPVWKSYNRCKKTDEMPERRSYLENLSHNS